MSMLQLVTALFFMQLATLVGLAFAARQLQQIAPSRNLCETIVIGYGYPCQQYTVTTEDGYILQLQRIPYGLGGQQQSNRTRIPVFLQHGLLQGGENWVMNDPSESLAFILADQGFDVWIGNTRGSRASQGHISLSTYNTEYWNWSFHECGIYDVPAMLEIIYKTTGSKISYIGHSQGTTIALIALTQKQVTSMLSSAILLSPVAYIQHVTPKFPLFLAHIFLDKFLLDLHLGEFTPTKGIGYDILQEACKIQGIDCSTFISVLMGANTYLNKTRASYYFQFTPQSTSTKNAAHVAQLVRNGEFINFDYGSPTKNMEYYNQSTPPPYDVSSYPPDFPVLLASGGIDGLADVEDVKTLGSKMNCDVTHVFREEYGHADYIIGTTANIDVYGDFIQYIVNHS